MRKFWTLDEIAKIKELYPNTPTLEIATQLGRTQMSIYGQANLLGLRKSEEFVKSEASGRMTKARLLGVASQFPKGHEPWNKGVKGLKIGGEQTQFKKGHLPKNTKHDGAITIRKDHQGRPYKHIRLEKARWVLLHRYTWELVNGTIPDGYNIQFKDGNSLNCSIDNLEMVTKEENMARNTIYRYPDEIVRLIKINGRLKRTIKKHKEYEPEKQ